MLPRKIQELKDWWWSKPAAVHAEAPSSSPSSYGRLAIKFNETAVPEAPVKSNGSEELAKWLQELTARQAIYKDKKEKWEERKKVILGDVNSAPYDPSTEKHKEEESVIKRLFNEFVAVLKETVMSADSNLKALMEATEGPHILALTTFSNEICAKLNKLEDKKSEEAMQDKVEICDTNIEVLDVLTDLIDEVINLIEYCKKTVHFGVVGAMAVAKFALFALTQIVMPDMDLGFDQKYGNLLQFELSQDKKRLTDLLDDAEGAELRAENTLEPSDPGRFSRTSIFSKDGKVPELPDSKVTDPSVPGVAIELASSSAPRFV